MLQAGLVAIAIAAPTVALALEGRLVGLGGSDIVFVWRNSDAHSEGLSLIRAGVLKSNPSLISVLLSCLPKSGTRAIITDFGFATHDILVIEGENSGCRGNIAAEVFKR